MLVARWGPLKSTGYAYKTAYYVRTENDKSKILSSLAVLILFSAVLTWPCCIAILNLLCIDLIKSEVNPNR